MGGPCFAVAIAAALAGAGPAGEAGLFWKAEAEDQDYLQRHPDAPHLPLAAAGLEASAPHRARRGFPGANRTPVTPVNPHLPRYKEIVMSRLHRIGPLAALVTALALFTLALALSPAGAARAATTTVTYTLATATATPVTASCDIPPCQFISYTLAGPGTTTSAAVPASGNFTWTFTPSKTSNSHSCAFTQGTGTLDVTWADATTTEVSFSFKARDSHSWAIEGQVDRRLQHRLPADPGHPGLRGGEHPDGPV